MNNRETKPLPAISICPMAGFKKEGYYYKVNDVMKNTLNLSDIISDATYNDTKNLLYDEPIAQQIGRCFSLKNQTGYELNVPLPLIFKTNYDLKVYIHSKGDELWLSGFQEFPFETASVTLDITKQQNYSMALISIKEINSFLHSKPDMPCTNYGDGSTDQHELFATCSKESLWRNLPSDMICTFAEMKPVIPNNSTRKECDNVNGDLVEKNYYWYYINYLEKFLSKPWQYDCPVPCKQTAYQVKLKYYHKNNARYFDATNKSKDHFTLYSFYPTFDVEEKIETLEYDLANLLVSAGGNLGLFLGFSCFSVMLSVINWLQAKFAS